MSTIRPLDRESILSAARETGAIVVAEEHLVHCGLGSMVAQALAGEHPVPMGFVGMKDRYAESGRWDLLMEKYGLTAEAIAAEARRLLERKAKGP
jgi:transketolase